MTPRSTEVIFVKRAPIPCKTEPLMLKLYDLAFLQVTGIRCSSEDLRITLNSSSISGISENKRRAPPTLMLLVSPLTVSWGGIKSTGHFKATLGWRRFSIPKFICFPCFSEKVNRPGADKGKELLNLFGRCRYRAPGTQTDIYMMLVLNQEGRLHTLF